VTARCLTALVCLITPLFAQHRVDPRNMYERALCVVPFVGAGTPDDPRRPAYAPLPLGPGVLPSRDGIVAFSFQESDDGQLALVEFVAYSREAFKDLLADTRPEVKVFIKGKQKREDIEKEFKKYKKDFNLDSFGTVVP
jgi:hypothetical protein